MVLKIKPENETLYGKYYYKEFFILKNLEEVFKERDHIWFEIDDEEQYAFFNWAKENGCKWVSEKN